MKEKIEYLHNHQEIMRSITAECAILMPRLEALNPNAPDYVDHEMEFLDDFIEVGVTPFNTIVTFMKTYHPDDKVKSAEMVQTGEAVGEIFRIMTEKRTLHTRLFGQK